MKVLGFQSQTLTPIEKIGFPCKISSSDRKHETIMKSIYTICILLTLTSFSSASLHGRKILDSPDTQKPLEPPLAPNKPSIDPNLVLILAALLCALFFGLGLNLMIRCALCLTSLLRMPTMAARGRMTSADHVTQVLGATRSNTGLKKAVVDALPLVSYTGGGGGAIECVICLREFVEGEKVRVLPKCEHCFHVECIDRWFVSHSLCPICRCHMPEILEKKSINGACSNCGSANGDESTAPDESLNVGVESAPSDLAACTGSASGSGSNLVAAAGTVS